MLGFVIGIARLSTNWLVARLATVYVEMIRNVPLLLQLFFWYFAVLQEPAGAAAEPRAAGRRHSSTCAGSICRRRCPRLASKRWRWRSSIGVVASIAVYVLARRRQMQTGQRLPVLWITLALIVLLPLGVVHR